MKTTDLIPIILYQLVDGDKYGYEIVKQIEDYSNGGIVIKQPTLYSVLKKLEQGRFISSYWQDSEIGGKRHYYKLTDNGKAQLSTYPPLETLIKDAMESEGIVISSPITSATPVEYNSNQVNNDENHTISVEADTISYSDQETITPTPIDLTTNHSDFSSNDINKIKIEPINISIEESVLPTSFEPLNDDEQLDKLSIVDNVVEIEKPNTNNIFENNEEHQTSTTFSIFDAIDYNNSTQNEQNSITESQDESKSEEPMLKFAEKVEPITEPEVTNKLYEKLTPNTDISLIAKDKNNEFYPTETIEQVKFLNYVDFSKDKAILKRRNAITKHIQKMTITCLTLLLAFVASIIVCGKYSFSKAYYACAIIVCVILILYPITLIARIPKIRFKYCSRPFKYSISKDFFIKLSLFLSLVIVTFAYNLSIATDIKNIFKISNFANFLAPIMFAIVIMLDFIYSVLLYRQYTNKQKRT
ncbi:MAG: helix-turn-helix transcriptional regulator [Clostridia bacterium]|nr:helix-turn-helix transcriptional regulator [Clostridia bacterium]